MTKAQCIDPGMLLKSFDVSKEATPAKDSLRQCHPWRLISDVATRRGQCGDPRKLPFVDISKASLHPPVMRNDIYVELPAEMEQPGCCGRLRKALYGTREAARCWEQEYHAGQNDYRPAFFISTSNSRKNDRDPVKDPRIPGKCQNEFPV